MTKFICIVLALVCLGAVTVHGQYTTDVKCTTLSECICKLPKIIGAVAGRKASATIRNPVNGQTYTLDLSKPSQAVADYCAQLQRGQTPQALPFAPPVNGNKLAQVQALLAARGIKG
ncbi:uncharacterized protein LOC131286136 [Anopheles ziemanni]|uniref:uncharacterized protein LOC131258997 n=1 Tax=Anopheles coustani TaxID=139045 RepID=UPI002657F7FE|nr:uncharacterized protein LOC131258997 [Anopheles coustani]XP_058171010.1 uncharacterized protein LOC131286136 [Anopheles ziemanni]